MKPPRPTGTSRKAYFWQWAYDRLCALEPRSGPGILTDDTTRGVFQRMYPQRRIAAAPSFQITWHPRPDYNSPLADVSGGFCYNYTKSELAKWRAGDIAGAIQDTAESTIAHSDGYVGPYGDATNSDTGGLFDNSAAVSSPFVNASRLRFRLSAPSYADSFPDVIGATDYSDGRYIYTNEINPDRTTFTGPKFRFDFPSSKTKPFVAVKILELPFLNTPTNGWAQTPMNYVPALSSDGFHVYSCHTPGFATSAFSIILPTVDLIGIAGPTGIHKPRDGSWGRVRLISNFRDFYLAFSSRRDGRSPVYSNEDPDWSNRSLSRGAGNTVERRWGGRFVVYKETETWEPPNWAENPYKLTRYPGLEGFFPYLQSFPQANVQMIPLTESFDQTIDLPTPSASGAFVVQAFFPWSDLFPLRTEADDSEYEFTLTVSKA